jgi:hypothetical protein
LDDAILAARVKAKQYAKIKSGGFSQITTLDDFFEYVKKEVPDLKDSEFVTKLFDLSFNDKIHLNTVADKSESWNSKFVIPIPYSGELNYIS